MRRAWLTPDPPESGDLICVKMMIPAGDTYAAAFRGALLPLCDPANWEAPTVDAEYPAVAAELFGTLWASEWEPWEDNCEDGMVNPVGTVFPFAGVSAPTDALSCDGSQVEQSAYPELYAILGTTWGSADSGYFRLPDLRSRVLVGAGQGSGLSEYAVGDDGGEETHGLLQSEIPAHAHGLSALYEAFNTALAGTASRFRPVGGGTQTESFTDLAGGDEETPFSVDPHENRPPYAAVLWCVWATP